MTKREMIAAAFARMGEVAARQRLYDTWDADDYLQEWADANPFYRRVPDPTATDGTLLLCMFCSEEVDGHAATCPAGLLEALAAVGADGPKALAGNLGLDERTPLLVRQFADRLLTHLATISGEGQGAREDVAHWVRVELGQAKHEDRYAETTTVTHEHGLGFVVPTLDLSSNCSTLTCRDCARTQEQGHAPDCLQFVVWGVR